jgi:hypothetical protein
VVALPAAAREVLLVLVLIHHQFQTLKAIGTEVLPTLEAVVLVVEQIKEDRPVEVEVVLVPAAVAVAQVRVLVVVVPVLESTLTLKADSVSIIHQMQR